MAEREKPDALAILNAIHNIVVAVDLEGRIVVFNEGAARAFGYPREKAIGAHITEAIPYTGLLRVLETGKPHIARKFSIGERHYVVNRTPIRQEGRMVGAVGVAQEITELERIAEELAIVKELKGLLETILESGHEGYLAVNAEGHIIMLNKAFADLLGVRPEEVMGKHINEVVEDSELPLVCRTGEQRVGEVVNFRGRQVVVARYPIKRDGEIIGAVAKLMFKDVNELITLAEKVKCLRRELAFYKNELARVMRASYSVDNLIGETPVMRRLKETIVRVAQGPSTVLIQGESGTGKELIAHAIHMASYRRNGPFVRVNCAAVPESLLESELFGYREGAFTGARRGGQIGKFEQANGGTIFLDEIGDMPLSMQAKLLRVLQEKEIERLGEGRPRKVDVRVVAATNRDIEALIREGKFREDLYYRLNVVSLTVPPLRERMDDIKPLVRHFIDKFNQQFGLQVTDLTPEVWALFHRYHWPGNVRELENVIERAFNLVEGPVISVLHLPMYLQRYGQVKRRAEWRTLPALLEHVEREAVREALVATGGNKLQAAKMLGISRAWLYKKMKQHGIDLK